MSIRFTFNIAGAPGVVFPGAMSLASAATAPSPVLSMCRGRFQSRQPASRDAVAGRRSREFGHERWMSNPRAGPTAGAVRDDDFGSMDEEDPPLSPTRAAADPRRASRNPRPPVEPGPEYHGRPSRAELERSKRGERSKHRKRGYKGYARSLAEGGEVFAVVTAMGVATVRVAECTDLEARHIRARRELTAAASAEVKAGYDAYRPSVAVAAALSNPALFQAPAGIMIGDLALVAAVAFSSVLRRIGAGKSSADDKDENESSFSQRNGSPSDSVLARVRRLESAHDRVALAASRNARDLSKVSTRVRLVRRELSPALRKVEAQSAARDAEAAVLETRVAKLGEELRSSQSTIGALQGVTAKQFDALAGAVTDLKRQSEGSSSRGDRARGGKGDAGKGTGKDEAAATSQTTPSGSPGAVAESASETVKTQTPEVVDADADVDEPEPEPRDEDIRPTTTQSETSSETSAAGNVMRVQRRRSLTFRVGGSGGKSKRTSKGLSKGNDASLDESSGDDVCGEEADEVKE